MVVALVALFASMTGIAVSKGKNAPGKVPANSIGTKQLKPNAVTQFDVAPKAIGRAALESNAVGAAALDSASVDGSKIKDGTIEKGDLGNQVVDSAKIAKLPGASAVEDQTVSVGGSAIQLTYDTELFDFTGGMYSNSSDPAKMVAPRDGVYQVTLSLMWEAEAGIRTVTLIEEQASPACTCEFDGDTTPASASGPTSQSITSTVEMDTGDKVWAVAGSDGDDGSTDILNTRRTRLTMVWIGPAK
jgi:hypothetical protein